MIDPELVRNGIHHCATGGNACGGCPIAAYCDYGNLDPEIIKTIDVMLLSQKEFKLCESPRVMTLEEVKQMGKKNMEHGDNPYKTCIYERRGNARLCICSPFWQAPQYEGDENYLNIDYCFIGTDEFDNYPTEYYGQWMRCWTSLPTNDQREATPWG